MNHLPAWLVNTNKKASDVTWNLRSSKNVHIFKAVGISNTFIFTAQSGNQEDDAGIVIVPLEYQQPIGLLPKISRAQLDVDAADLDGPTFFNPFADLVNNLEGKRTCVQLIKCLVLACEGFKVGWDVGAIDL